MASVGPMLLGHGGPGAELRTILLGRSWHEAPGPTLLRSPTYGEEAPLEIPPWAADAV